MKTKNPTIGMKLMEAFPGLTGANRVSVPVATLPRHRPVEVEYIYTKGQPRSHMLQFRKGRVPKFQMTLFRHGEDIKRLCSALENATRPDPTDAGVGFWTRLGLRFLGGGALVSCRESIEPSTLDRECFGEWSNYSHRHRIAHMRGRRRESLLLLETVTSKTRRRDKWSPTFKTRRRNKWSPTWFRLSVPEADLLAGQLRAFLAAGGGFDA